MEYSQTSTSLGSVRHQLGTLLKSDVAIDPLAKLTNGSFRSFVSPTISVLAVHGGAVAIQKGASHASDVHLLQLQHGSVELLHADGNTRLSAGQYLAFQGAQAIEFRHEQRIELLAVFVPGAAIERWLPDWRAAEFVTVASDQAEGRLSFEIARGLLDCGKHLHDGDAAELVGETVTRLLARSLAMTALVDAAPPQSLSEAQRRKVRQFCRSQLTSPSLSIDMVVRATGLSRASLHRLFHDQPHTLMQWVQLERLEACRRSLAAPGLPNRTLTEIALAHGFKGSAHFSTAFRQRYGLTPRDYRSWALSEHSPRHSEL